MSGTCADLLRGRCIQDVGYIRVPFECAAEYHSNQKFCGFLSCSLSDCPRKYPDVRNACRLHFLLGELALYASVHVSRLADGLAVRSAVYKAFQIHETSSALWNRLAWGCVVVHIPAFFHIRFRIWGVFYRYVKGRIPGSLPSVLSLWKMSAREASEHLK